MTPIESPNLPKRGIALAAVSVGAEKAKEYLESRGIAVFDILPSSAITDGTAAHADLHLLHLGERKIILSREQLENAQKLASSGFDVHILDIALGAEYPADVPLNAAVFGNYAILNPKTVCRKLERSVLLSSRVKPAVTITARAATKPAPPGRSCSSASAWSARRKRTT